MNILNNDSISSQSSKLHSSQQRKLQLNPVKHRLLVLSPTVKNCLEREANKDDFEALEDKNIGKGGFGCVWKVRHKITKQIYAIKVIDKKSIVNQNLVEQTNREIEIMYALDHPHIIKLYNHFEDDTDFCLIMQYAAKSHLYAQIKRLKRLDQKTAAQYMREVISAVKYLHERTPPIIHRDIKPENILLDSEGRCKLADFGWSNFHEGNKQRETYCGTPEYLAPEMINKSGHNEGIDIWSIGVLLFELLTGKTPFNFKGDRNQLYNSIKTLKICWTDDFPPLAKDLISKILRLKPSERLTLDQIIEHQWFKEIPQIKPVLAPYNYDKMQKLNSHLIHTKPNQDASSQNKNNHQMSLLNYSHKPIANDVKVNTQQVHHNESNVQMVNAAMNNQNTNSLTSSILSQSNTNKNNQIRTDRIQYEKDMRELNLLKEENAKKDKLILNLKEKLEKTESNISALRVREQERESIFSELDDKTNKLCSVQSELNLIKIDLEQQRKENILLKQKNDELSTKNIELDNKTRTLESKLLTTDQQKKEEISYLEAKLRRCEEEYMNNSENAIKEDPDKLIKITSDNISDLSKFVSQKFDNIQNKILTQELNEIEYRQNFTKTIDKRITAIIEDFKHVQNQISTEEVVLIKKQLDDSNKKLLEMSKSLDWYKSQLRELNQYKAKYCQNEIILKQKDDQLKRINEVKEIYEQRYNYLDNLVKVQDNKIDELKKAKEIYKNAFYDSEKIFEEKVKGKKLKEMINFNINFDDPA